ncbi:MAG: TIR domain-containing protein [Steroidobacteraceae bacterium]
MSGFGDPVQPDTETTRRTVFVSYASADAGIAEQACAALEAAGVPCWIAPRDVRPGDPYAAAIVEAINGCRLMVIVLSKNAIDSPHVLREVERASSKKRPLLSIRVDSAALPAELEYFLSSNQWLDASGGPVERVFPALIAAVRGRLGSSRQTEAGVDSAATPTPRQGRPGFRQPAIAAAAVFGLALAFFVADRAWLHKSGQPAAGAAPSTAPLVSEKSIAVLPFADMSEKHDQEYFSDGMAEEIIDLLVKMPELKVPARTSSFYFKGKATKIQDIARELGVANILEGSVRKSGDHLRVTAQLVRADNGFHLWSETYDRQLEDVFKTQDEIAGSVVKALKVSLLKADAPSAQLTTSSEAYELYLQARALASRGDTDDTIKGYQDLQQAVALDPKFALAWAALAQMLAQDNVDWTRVFSLRGPKPRTDEPDLSDWGVVWAQARAAAHAAADRAITLGPNLGETHAAKAYVLAWLDWQWAAADAEYAKALELAPTSARILRDAADINMALGRLPEGLDLANRALALDPLGSAWGGISYAQFALGDLDAAEKAARRRLEIRATSEGLHYELGNILLVRGDAKAALSVYEESTAAQWRAVGVPLALDALGRRREADDVLTSAEQKYGNGMAYQIACVYAGRKDLDRTFQWLDRAYKQRDGGLNALKVDPMLQNVRQDPRYKTLLLKMNLPV